MNRRNPRSLVAMAIGLWSFGPLLQKLIANSSRYLLLAVVFACGLATFTVIQLAQHGRGAWTNLRRLRWQYPAMGLLGYFGYMSSMNRAFRYFPSAAGPTMLNYTWPVFTLVFSELIFARTRKPGLIRAIEGTGTALGFLGVFVMATEGDPLGFRIAEPVGVLWGLSAGICYGLFSAYSATVPGEDHGVFLMSAIGASLLAMLPLAASEARSLGSLPHGAYLAAVGQGVLMNGMGYFLWTSALRLAREQGIRAASITSLIFFLPLLSIAVVSVALGEREVLRPYFVASLASLLLGLALCQWTEPIAERIVGRKHA